MKRIRKMKERHVNHSKSTKYYKFYNMLLILISGICIFSISASAQVTKENYKIMIYEAYEYNLKECDNIINNWKSNIKESNLFGYSTTSYPATFAELCGFLYQDSGEEKYARKAVEMLLVYEELKKIFPKEYYEDRVEYAEGLPPISNFFSMYSYPKAYLYIKDCKSISKKDREIIEKGVADCANFLMNYPEWGPMNRAILRSETFFYAALALPDHPDRKKWERMAQVLSSDSYQRWEEEDAAGYHPVWLLSLMRMVEATGDKHFYRSAIPRYYFDYFVNLTTPAGLIADFGDARWPSDWYRFIPIYEKGAAVYQEPMYKWMVNRIWDRIRESGFKLTSAYVALTFVDAYKWMDETVQPEAPLPGSRLVMEDVVGKKVVFRDGFEPSSTFLLLNYRDEGEGAFAGREFLRTTITAEEEKTHHGHSDENSISSLFYDGSILLHDGGYRDKLPSGEYGRFRADYFHNRIVTRKNQRWIQLEGERKEQSLWEFIRNSGSYRPVETQLINFLTFDNVDYSRTRLIDEEMGYHWDRVIVYHKPDQFFVVVDAIKTLRKDFFTHANLWHSRHILQQGDQWFDTEIDSIGKYAANKKNNRLLIHFPVKEPVRTYGTFALNRHWQEEITMYETISATYYAGDMEVFVTVLYPHHKSVDVEELAARFSIIETDKFPSAVGIKYTKGKTTEIFGIKGDLEMDYLQQNFRPRYNYESGKVTYGPFHTDGNFLYGKIAGKKIHWACSNMTKVKYNNFILHESLNLSFGLQPDGAGMRYGRAKWRYWEDELEIK
jgi:hypothetical protein